MDDQQILGLLRSAFAYASEGTDRRLPETVSIDAQLSELGIESITAVEMAGYIENELKVQFSDDQLASVVDIRGFVNLIRTSLAAAA